MKKLAFAAGLTVGYVIGTRVGRSGYEHLVENARAFWQIEAVQTTVHNLEESAKNQAKHWSMRLWGKVSQPSHRAGSSEKPNTPLSGSSS